MKPSEVSSHTARDIPQIYYILGKFELTKNLIKSFEKFVSILGVFSSTPFKTFENKLYIVKSSIYLDLEDLEKVMFTPHFVLKGIDRADRPHDHVVW